MRYLLLPLGLLALAACGTDDAGSTTPAADLEIEIEVDVMSGVPNPTWTVRGDEARELVDLVAALPESGEVPDPAALELGFRGFVLRGLDLADVKDGGEVRVLGEQIIMSSSAGVGQERLDEDRAVYTRIRTMSAEHVDENILQAIPADGLKGSP